MSQSSLFLARALLLTRICLFREWCPIWALFGQKRGCPRYFARAKEGVMDGSTAKSSSDTATQSVEEPIGSLSCSFTSQTFLLPARWRILLPSSVRRWEDSSYSGGSRAENRPLLPTGGNDYAGGSDRVGGSDHSKGSGRTGGSDHVASLPRSALALRWTPRSDHPGSCTQPAEIHRFKEEDGSSCFYLCFQELFPTRIPICLKIPPQKDLDQRKGKRAGQEIPSSARISVPIMAGLSREINAFAFSYSFSFPAHTPIFIEELCLGKTVVRK